MLSVEGKNGHRVCKKSAAQAQRRLRKGSKLPQIFAETASRLGPLLIVSRAGDGRNGAG